MEACLDEELPPTTELEEGLRNGVYLAKLGNFFAPHTVSLKKIYDREQTRYKVKARLVYSIIRGRWNMFHLNLRVAVRGLLQKPPYN